MTSAAYPTVYAALVTTIDNAPPVRVVDGYDTSSDPGDVVMVGVPSLSSTTSISAGSFTQAPGPMGSTRPRDENGTINGVVMAWKGDGDASAARTAAFGYIASIESALRTDPAIGVTTFARLVVQFASGDVLEDKVDGAACAISWTVSYVARI